MSYRASVGYHTPFGGGPPVRLADVTDGASSTLLLGEHANGDPWWSAAFGGPGSVAADGPSYVGGGYEGGPYALAYNPFNYRLPADAVGAALPTLSDYFFRRVYSFGSDHPGGADVALCDGSVRFVADGINPATFAALGTIDGGEVVRDF
jgi:prepilin-type processing-associated H-X9-DG protein